MYSLSFITLLHIPRQTCLHHLCKQNLVYVLKSCAVHGIHRNHAFDRSPDCGSPRPLGLRLNLPPDVLALQLKAYVPTLGRGIDSLWA